ncbi:MAG: cobalt-zinc-cadmium efflux system outer membrane protein [Planctomycetota bacterium]|jgi:cobalt-zinc-cadmium efflux system outer membrane protein
MFSFTRDPHSSIWSRSLESRLSIVFCFLTGACASNPDSARPSTSAYSPNFRASEVETPADELTTDEATPKGLDGLIRLALANNPNIRAARAQLQASRDIAPQVASLPDPELTGSYFIEEVETRVGPQEWSLGIRQRFPSSDALEASRSAAEIRTQADRAQLGAVMQAVVLEVKLAWYELFYLERAILSFNEDRDRLQSVEEVIRRDYATGSAAYTTLIRAQVELGQSENKLAGLRDQRVPAIARLNVVLHRSIQSPVSSPNELQVPNKLLSTEELEQRMADLNPELQRIQFEKRAAKADQNRADHEGSPDYTLGLQYINTGGARSANVPGNGDDPLVATFSIGLPVRRARLDAASRAARARTRMMSANVESKLDQLRSELAQAHFLARDAERQINLYQSSLLPRAKQSFDAIEADFRSGQSDFNELIDAKRVLLDFRLALQRALTDRAIAHARLEFLVGASATQFSSNSPADQTAGSQK